MVRRVEEKEEGGRKTDLVLFPGEVPDLPTPLYTRLPIVRCSSREEVQPVIDELFGVLARRAKVYQLDLHRRTPHYKKDEGARRTRKRTHLPRPRIPQKVRPIRIRLHHAEDKQLAQTEVDDAFGDL